MKFLKIGIEVESKYFPMAPTISCLSLADKVGSLNFCPSGVNLKVDSSDLRQTNLSKDCKTLDTASREFAFIEELNNADAYLPSKECNWTGRTEADEE